MKIQFKPMLWPSIFSILTFAILISFGTWQVKRLFWKEALIQNYITQSQSNPITDPVELEKSSIISFSRGASVTISFVMPVISAIRSEIGI